MTALTDKQTEVMNFAQEVFNKATGYSQSRSGRNPRFAYVYALPDFDYTIQGLSGPIGIRGFQDIGIDRDRNYNVTNVMTVIIESDCSSVVTAFPGLPGDFNSDPNARITGTPHWWIQGRGWTWRR
jgi:hypothetical protein